MKHRQEWALAFLTTAIICLLIILFALWLVQPAQAHGSRIGWAKPDTPCNAEHLGRMEWVYDVQLDGWVKWKCQRMDDGRYRWVRIEIAANPPLNVRHEENGWNYHAWNGARAKFYHSDCDCGYWHYYPFWSGYAHR